MSSCLQCLRARWRPQSLAIVANAAAAAAAASRFVSPATLRSSQRIGSPRAFSSAIYPLSRTSLPRLTAPSPPSPPFRPASLPPPISPPPGTRSFSASASLPGKRNTFNPSWRVRKRRHGFLARLRTKSGQKVLARRRLKGRRALSW